MEAVRVEPVPAVDWWWVRRDGVAHAFHVGTSDFMTSLCGRARWTALSNPAEPRDARCADCERDGMTEAEARLMDGNR